MNTSPSQMCDKCGCIVVSTETYSNTFTCDLRETALLWWWPQSYWQLINNNHIQTHKIQSNPSELPRTLTSVTYASVMGGPRMGLNLSPMLRTTVLKTRSRAASLGRDTVGGGMSSSTASPDTTWLKSYKKEWKYSLFEKGNKTKGGQNGEHCSLIIQHLNK